MRFPQERMKYSPTYQGKEAPAGYVVLTVRGLDLEGTNELWVDLAQVEQLRGQQGAQEDAVEKFKRLLGGE